MLKALAAVAMHLHPAYDASEGALPGNSKESCLFSSLTLRDFLQPRSKLLKTPRGAPQLRMRANDPAAHVRVHSAQHRRPPGGDPDRPHKLTQARAG